MLAVLVFDQLNDVVYLRCDHKFVRHVLALARTQRLLDKDVVDEEQVSSLDPNIVVQLFSPLVTSQRIMASQFNNPYTSIACQDGTNVVFQEYAGYLFVGIGTSEESQLHRVVSITIRMVQLIVGPCVAVLKKHEEKCSLLDALLETWQSLYAREQSYLVEAVERLVVNANLSAAAVKSLAAVIDAMKHCKELSPCHALFFVRNKLLALYSSRSASELTASDLLFLNLLVSANEAKTSNNTEDADDTESPPPPPTSETESESDKKDDDGIDLDSSDSGEFCSTPNTPSSEESTGKIRSEVLLLRTEFCLLTPHLVHHETLSDGLSLVIVSEVNRTQLSIQLLTLLSGLEEMLSGDVGGRGKLILDACDASVRKAHDLAKRIPKGKALERVERALQQVQFRWDTLKRSGLEEWLKEGGGEDSNIPTRIDASLTSLVDITRSAWRAACLMVSAVGSAPQVESAVAIASQQMADYCHFLEVKALRNMTLGCRSALTINKYLEDFPGLVHFLYIDRSTHQLTSPTLVPDEGGDVVLHDSPSAENSPAGRTRSLTVSRVWSMVEFARSHVSKGHLSLMWKDTTFNYAYFLWFEDGSSNPLKPGELDENNVDSLPIPGILCQDFYRAFCCRAFPGMDPSRIRIYELFCVHLGLATSPCVLEHTRRLAATIWEVAGPIDANPADLL